MTTSTRLDEALVKAEQSLLPPDYELQLVHLHRIWSLLGPRDTGKTVGEGHRRRARLALLAARRVLPLWKRWRPSDDRPQLAIAEAERYLATGSKESDDRLADFDVQLDNLAAKCDDAELMAGYAALYAARVAFHDEEFDPSTPPEEDEVGDLDAATAAALAYDDPEERRDFWRWYLREAVPSAAA